MESNKKGFVTTGLVSLLVYLGFVLIIILFFFIFKLGIGDTTIEIKGVSGDADSEYVFLNYLRTPITINIENKEEQLTFADIITKYYLAQDAEKTEYLKKIIELETQKYLNKNYPNLEWRLYLKDTKSNNKPSLIAKGQTHSDKNQKNTLVSKMTSLIATLPNPELKDPIQIELRLISQDSIKIISDQTFTGS